MGSTHPRKQIKFPSQSTRTQSPSAHATEDKSTVRHLTIFCVVQVLIIRCHSSAAAAPPCILLNLLLSFRETFRSTTTAALYVTSLIHPHSEGGASAQSPRIMTPPPPSSNHLGEILFSAMDSISHSHITHLLLWAHTTTISHPL